MKQIYAYGIIIGIILIGLIVLLVLPKNNTIDLNYSVKYADTNDRITLNYDLYVDGNVIDSSYDRNEPFTFVIGSGNTIKGFDTGVIGLIENQEKQIVVKPDEGYGTENDYPYKYQDDLNAIINEISSQTGSVLKPEQIQNGTFYDVLGRKCIFDGFDLNTNIQYINCQHKLAGKTLVFVVKVISIEKYPDYLTENTNSIIPNENVDMNVN